MFTTKFKILIVCIGFFLIVGSLAGSIFMLQAQIDGVRNFDTKVMQTNTTLISKLAKAAVATPSATPTVFFRRVIVPSPVK